APLAMPTTLPSRADGNDQLKQDHQPVVGTGVVCLVCDSLLTSTRSGQGYYITNRLAAIERLAKFKLPQVRPKLECRPDLAQHVWRLLVLNTVVWLQWIGEWQSWLQQLPPRPSSLSMTSERFTSPKHGELPAPHQALTDVDPVWPPFLRHSVARLPIMFRQGIYQLTSEELGLEYALRQQPLVFPLQRLQKQSAQQDCIAFSPTTLAPADELHLQCALLFPWRAIGSVPAHSTIAPLGSEPPQSNAIPTDLDRSSSITLAQRSSEPTPPCVSLPGQFMPCYFAIPTQNKPTVGQGYLGMIPTALSTQTQSLSLDPNCAPRLIPLFDAFAIYGPNLGSQIYAYCLSHVAPKALTSQATLVDSYQMTGTQVMDSAALVRQACDPDQTYVSLGIKASPLGLGFAINLFRLHQYSIPLK
ncbi:hypothetical protein H4R34_005842, partial [Dimargaris verticillata]